MNIDKYIDRQLKKCEQDSGMCQRETTEDMSENFRSLTQLRRSHCLTSVSPCSPRRRGLRSGSPRHGQRRRDTPG